MTKQVLTYLKAQIEGAKEEWLSQGFIDFDNSERSAAMNLMAIGKCQGLMIILALDSQELNQFFEEKLNDTLSQLNHS